MKRLLLIGMALLSLIFTGSLAQTPDSIQIADAIVAHSDVDVLFTNDGKYLWNIEDNVAIIRGQEDRTYSTSWLTMTFSLKEKSEVSFEWACYYYMYSYHNLQFYLNGVYDSQTTNGDYQLRRFILEPGEYVFAFRDSIGNSNDTRNWSAIKNLKIKTIVSPDYSPAVIDSDIDTVIFNNDNWLRPWYIEDNVAIIRGREDSPTYSTSWLTMTFSLKEKSEISFEWACYYYMFSYHNLQFYLNGVYDSQTTNGDYQLRRFILEPGEYVFAFRDSIGNSNDTRNWSAIKNLKIKTVRSLESVALTDKSIPLTFANNSDWPWMIQDDYIRSGNFDVDNSVSKFSTTITLNKTSRLSYQVLIPSYHDSYYNGNHYSDHTLYIDVNGINWNYWESKRDWTTDIITLEPGEYTITWIDTIRSNSHNYDFRSLIRNIELTSNWVEVELATAGTLGVEALYKVDILNELEMLKVKGPMNATDWATIKQMNNIVALDLSEAVFDNLPDYAFDGLTWLGSVILPEGLKTIGSYAFRGTRMVNIHIPSTVVTIGKAAFENVNQLRYLSFADNSHLQNIEMLAFQNCAKLQVLNLPEPLVSIGYRAFYGCSSIESVFIPNTVTAVEAYAFYGCSNMQSIHFSDSMTEIREWICSECYSLTSIHLPKNLNLISCGAFENNKSLRNIELPNSLRTIGYEAFNNCAIDSLELPVQLQYLGTSAFDNCPNLKYIVFPSYLERGNYIYRDYRSNGSYYNYESDSGYRSNFRNCPSIETIVMRSAAPPIVDADPFESSRTKSVITLKVPSFAVVNYKLDNYWYQFGQIVEGDDVEYWKITNQLSLTNNRRMNGKPDIDLYYSGQFTVGGNAPMEIGLFNLFVNESNPGRLLTTCEAMSADSINTYYSVSRDKWYFFTPVHDVDLSKVTVSNNASYVFRYFDGSSRATSGTGNSWRNVDSPKLIAGQGYIFQCDADAVITMPASALDHSKVFNTADVTKPLEVYEAAASANKSWNYVGNPYPCYYDIYYMDFTAPITVWTGSTYKAYSIADDQLALRPMQSFFVQKPDAVDNIVFRREGRQLTADVNHSTGANHVANRSVDRHFFELKLSNEKQADETRLVINDAASLKYEIERDASKFMSFDASVPQLFTLDSDGNGYAINERPLDNGEVTLAYYSGESGFLTISALRSEGGIYLYDTQQNKTVDLTKQDYTFYTGVTDGADTSRFIIRLSIDGTTKVDNIEKEHKNENTIYDLQGRIIENPDGNHFYIQNGQLILK